MLVVIILLIILIEPNAATGPNSQKPASTKTGTSKPVAALTESAAAAISMKQTSIESILSVPALDEQDGNEFVMDDNHKLEEIYLKFYAHIGDRGQLLSNPLCVQKNLRKTACTSIANLPRLRDGGVSTDSTKEPSECRKNGTPIELWEKPGPTFYQTTFECYIRIKDEKGHERNSKLYVTPRGIKTNGAFVSFKIDLKKEPKPTDAALLLCYMPHIYFDPSSSGLLERKINEIKSNEKKRKTTPIK